MALGLRRVIFLQHPGANELAVEALLNNSLTYLLCGQIGDDPGGQGSNETLGTDQLTEL